MTANKNRIAAMPRAYPDYPYIEPIAANLSEAEIVQMVEDMLSQNPTISLNDGGPLDKLCRALNVDVEYSDAPNEILLDVPLNRHAVIWLPRRGKPRQDRMTLATGIGHWLLHVPVTREAYPHNGIQALYSPTDTKALREARLFAFDLLMPEETFTNLWYEGRAQLTAETLNVPTQAVYDRARWLDLTSVGDHASHDPSDPDTKADQADPNPPPQSPGAGMGGYARRVGS
ncbi:ImmA/IrrE family metallo-endopeptidase [Tropicibacter oceani]|uniref:ImmA/IrrE family metallo-endopeptidase n=1 Tax=Tropicibacter oceani TaxID=3058420 RepID=A0ABY8QHS1_9RHOB|nr:ImmA/IrrE family metallo-endopeptidase [Tropicibacter oceani]WGW04089.1 ImmA/IrrE family metallo-endopeptidase [Tropicibacter oceani]